MNGVWERRLVWFLRISAWILLSALVAVVMPTAIMAWFHEFTGLGELPRTPLVAYLARSASALYAMLGLTYWRLARNVPRYLDLLRFFGQVKLAFGIGMLALDRAVGMPLWWTATEGPFIIAWSLALLALVRKTAEERGGRTSEASDAARD